MDERPIKLKVTTFESASVELNHPEPTTLSTPYQSEGIHAEKITFPLLSKNSSSSPAETRTRISALKGQWSEPVNLQGQNYGYKEPIARKGITRMPFQVLFSLSRLSWTNLQQHQFVTLFLKGQATQNWYHIYLALYRPHFFTYWTLPQLLKLPRPWKKL